MCWREGLQVVFHSGRRLLRIMRTRGERGDLLDLCRVKTIVFLVQKKIRGRNAWS